jgi:hypothetical protein
MRKSILAVLSAAGLASFAASNASAMPIAQPVAPNFKPRTGLHSLQRVEEMLVEAKPL